MEIVENKDSNAGWCIVGQDQRTEQEKLTEMDQWIIQ